MKHTTLARTCLFWLFLCVIAGCTSVQTPSPTSSSSPAVENGSAHEALPPSRTEPTVVAAVPYYPPPAEIDLCGEPVPFEFQEVVERFDKEFTLIVYNHAQVYLWLKRMERYFPWVEERLRFHNLPDDLKYVAVVESDLLPNVCSPKGAAGPWQFMPSTGSSCGLDQQGTCDQRYDFERSTDAAFCLLRDLYKRYNNWALAIAAYNCGDKRLMDEMRTQHTNDYYHLKLPLETERYVFRILAIKAVLSNPERYGYHLPPGQGYGELHLDKVRVTLNSPVSIQNIATAAGMTFREFKRLNPVYRADDIPAGSHELKLSHGCGKVFERNFQSGKLTAAASHEDEPVEKPTKPTPAKAEPAKPQIAKEPAAKEASKEPPAREKETPKAAPAKQAAAKHHVVKKGDTLSSIAHQYKVSVEELKKTNKISGKALKPGEKLQIP